MSLASKLRNFSEKKYVGPIESFNYVHVGLLVYYLGEQAPKSRSEIAEFLDIGEGSVRTVLKRLKEKALINITRAGVFLSRKGVKLFSEFKLIFPILTEVSYGLLSLDGFSVIVLIKSKRDKVSYGIEQRDIAIKYGAKGAMTLTYKNEHFMIPGEDENCEMLFPNKDWAKIHMALQPEEGDVIIICSAEKVQEAYLGCFAAALTLIQ